MLKIVSIHDIISISLVLLNIYILVTLQIELFGVNILAIIAHKYIKHYTIGIYPSIFKRPDDACDCSMFNCGGYYGNKSGFPSGHMTSTSLYMNGLLFKSMKPLTVYNIILYNIPCLLMAIARYQKRCHNIVQIVVGYSFGLSIAYILKKAYYDKYNNESNEEEITNEETRPLTEVTNNTTSNKKEYNTYSSITRNVLNKLDEEQGNEGTEGN